MEVDEVTEFIRKILGKSEALQYCEYFKGISDEKFQSYALEDLKHVLPSTEEGELAATEIKEQIELALKMEKVRAEMRAGGRVASSSQPTEIEGQAACMDESGADVSSVDGIDVKILPPKLKEIVEITLDSDDEEVRQPHGSPESCVSSDGENSDSEDLSTSKSSESDDSDVEGSRPKRKCHVELASTTGRPVRNCRARKQPVLNLGSKVTCAHTCMTEEGSRDQKWYDEIHGQYCTTINAYQWCWQPLSHRCKYNLFRILCNSPNVEKLKIFNDATNTPADINLPEGSLLKLKEFLACRRGNMNTGNNLRTILKMATNLKWFIYEFSTETDEDLEFLTDIVLPKLQILSISSCSKPSYLKRAQIEKLSRIRAPKLKMLRMGDGLYEDVSGSILKKALEKFPTLQDLHIPGHYYGQTGTHPEVAITFPKLRQLKYLNFGGSYDYAPTVNTHEKDEPRTLEREHTKPFHVTLKFVEIWSKLNTLILGNTYHIDSLHLKCFPKLEVLRVGSPWHLSVVFPGKMARSCNYPLISDLQLPDGLNDASFLKILNIPERFPNVKTCRLALPSALVLRTFLNVMKDAGLKELRLKTRFDFSSTLESCLLDKVLPIKTTSEDWQRVTELEKYEKWTEFVDQHNIILPFRTDEEVQEFVEAAGEYGLGALKHLDMFNLRHIPRILRVPHGESNEAATATTLQLGYRKYPISTECCDAVRRISMRFWWNLEEPVGERERWMKAGYWPASGVDTTDDERTEIEAGSAIDYSNSKEENKEKED